VKYDSVKVNNGARMPTPALAGKTYLVSRKAGTVVVTDPKAGKVPTDEESAVASDWKQVGRPDEVDAAIRSKPRKVGDSLEDAARALEKRWGEEFGDGGVKNVTITFASLDHVDGHDVATLAIAMTVAPSRSGLSFEMLLAGTLRIRTDDMEIVDGSLTGPIRIGGVASGSGAMSFESKSWR